VAQSMKAASLLERNGIDAEVIDLRSIKPWDRDMVLQSVAKSGRVLIVDGAWKTGGVAAEIAATIAEEVLEALRAPIRRVTLPDAPAPMSKPIESKYYFGPEAIVEAATQVLQARALVR
jgi:acetoin:2,6-dichlorophenolindophenol oxidoreductase subunit beta